MDERAWLKSLIKSNRSYRRFSPDVRISSQTLHELVDLGRLSASSANLQPLKYRLVTSESEREKVFPCLGWAGYIKDWQGPEEEERPAAYIVFLGDTRLSHSFRYDAGIAVQSMLLGAAVRELGGCIIASVKRERLREELDIPDRYEILFVLALGNPNEEVKIDPLPPEGNIKYWRDEEGIHHVPKRPLDEIIID
ncbi:MAG: nitroreductase family protein [Anaerolineales bacterium]